jgi:hypothetical protein
MNTVVQGIVGTAHLSTEGGAMARASATAERKEKLAAGDPEAGYVSPDLSFSDGIVLDPDRQKLADEEAQARDDEVAAVEEHEDKVVKERRAQAEKEAKGAAKAEAKTEEAPAKS